MAVTAVLSESSYRNHVYYLCPSVKVTLPASDVKSQYSHLGCESIVTIPVFITDNTERTVKILLLWSSSGNGKWKMLNFRN